MKRIDLTKMKEGERGIVVELSGGCGLLSRLSALGIREGTEIKKVSSQLMRGPVIIQVGNTQIAIGFGMARKIIVEKKKSISRE